MFTMLMSSAASLVFDGKVENVRAIEQRAAALLMTSHFL